MRGWIKLGREITEWEWYQDANVCRLLIHLYLKATHTPVWWQSTELLPGQLITGRKVLAGELRLSEREIRTALTKLKSHSDISIKTTNKFSVITICNWAASQQLESTERPAGRPTRDQPSTTYKKVKNEKNSISDVFEAFRLSFPGTKRGLETELEYFLKKNKPEIVDLLLPALEMEKSHRTKWADHKEFVPPWKNLSTWINGKCWEQEFESTTVNQQSQKTPKEWL